MSVNRSEGAKERLLQRTNLRARLRHIGYANGCRRDPIGVGDQVERLMEARARLTQLKDAPPNSGRGL